MNKIDSQTEKWTNSSEGIDTRDLEKFLTEFNKNANTKTFYHHLYDMIDNFYHKNDNIIEVGGQFGANLFILNQGFKKTLLDLDPNAIKQAKEIYSRHNVDAKFIVGDMFSMPIADQSYDIVFNSGVLEHFTEPERILALGEYSRILKSGGNMVLAIPNHNSYFYRFYYLFLNSIGMWKIPKEFKIKNFQNEINKNNLQLIEEKIVSPEVIFDNYNNLFGLGTFLSALHKIFRKKLDNKIISKLNKKIGLGNFIKIINYFYKIDGYLLVFIIKKP